MLRRCHAVCVVVFVATVCFSQARPALATVTFSLDFPQSQPARYFLKIQSDGNARYESSSKVADSEEPDSFSYQCTISPATRDKIFELAAKASFFQKDLDSHRKNMAFTGRKTLAYEDPNRHGESNFIYATNSAVQELTSLFQGLSATLELGHRLEYSLRYQKLALADELKRTEDSARMSPPVEIQAIAPILHQIVADTSVMNVTRARAQRLLDDPAGR
jgi:hypothetical protein